MICSSLVHSNGPWESGGTVTIGASSYTRVDETMIDTLINTVIDTVNNMNQSGPGLPPTAPIPASEDR